MNKSYELVPNFKTQIAYDVTEPPICRLPQASARRTFLADDKKPLGLTAIDKTPTSNCQCQLLNWSVERLN